MNKLMKITIIACLGLFCSMSITAQAADAVVSKETAVMAKNLELSVDQTAQIEKVFTSYRQKQKAIESTSPNADENPTKLTELNSSLEKQLATILTPEQLKKWKTMQPQGK